MGPDCPLRLLDELNRLFVLPVLANIDGYVGWYLIIFELLKVKLGIVGHWDRFHLLINNNSWLIKIEVC